MQENETSKWLCLVLSLRFVTGRISKAEREEKVKSKRKGRKERIQQRWRQAWEKSQATSSFPSCDVPALCLFRSVCWLPCFCWWNQSKMKQMQRILYYPSTTSVRSKTKKENIPNNSCSFCVELCFCSPLFCSCAEGMKCASGNKGVWFGCPSLMIDQTVWKRSRTEADKAREDKQDNEDDEEEGR